MSEIADSIDKEYRFKIQFNCKKCSNWDNKNRKCREDKDVNYCIAEKGNGKIRKA